jgi:hypothetical protein
LLKIFVRRGDGKIFKEMGNMLAELPYGNSANMYRINEEKVEELNQNEAGSGFSATTSGPDCAKIT